MPYQRVWIPELQQWKIIGELTGEEALQLKYSIPAGLTQWGWNARTGIFAYGTTIPYGGQTGQIYTYETPPPQAAPYLIDRPETYTPTFNLNQTFEEVGSNITNGGSVEIAGSDGDAGQALGLGLALLIGIPLLFDHRRSVKHGKKKSRSKQKA